MARDIRFNLLDLTIAVALGPLVLMLIISGKWIGWACVALVLLLLSCTGIARTKGWLSRPTFYGISFVLFLLLIMALMSPVDVRIRWSSQFGMATVPVVYNTSRQPTLDQLRAQGLEEDVDFVYLDYSPNYTPLQKCIVIYVP